MSRPVRPVRPARPSTASPRSATSSRPRTAARAAVLAGTLLLTAGGAASAAAATPWAAIQTPLAAEERLEGDFASGALTATGNGHAAWVVADASWATATVWTVRDGAAARVAQISLPGGVGAVDLGTERGGAPVLAVATREAAGSTVLQLVRLDTGAVRKVAPVRRGLSVGGVAIDAGRYYFTVRTPTKTGPRNTSSLWRATLTGTSVGPASKLRTSRRGERWNAVHADLNRVAVETSGAAPADFDAAFLRENVAFGTPGGRWSRTPDNYATEGGYVPEFVLGFTRDRRGLVTEQNRGDGPSTAARVRRYPIGGGAVRTARVGAGQADLRGSALDPATGRILGFGPAPDGTPSVGWTGVAFP
jgi:hypothetical protein